MARLHPLELGLGSGVWVAAGACAGLGWSMAHTGGSPGPTRVEVICTKVQRIVRLRLSCKLVPGPGWAFQRACLGKPPASLPARLPCQNHGTYTAFKRTTPSPPVAD